LSDLYFINNSTGYICGAEYILKTTNGGANWTVSLYLPYIFSGICFVNSNTGFVVGGNRIYKTTNAGTNWNENYSITGGLISFEEIDFTDQNTGYAVSAAPGAGTLVKTTNGGLNWVILLGGGGYYPFELYCLDFIDGNTGFLGAKSEGYGDYIYKTTNGGFNWIRYRAGPDVFPLISISFSNYDSGYIMDDYSVLKKTTNGGNNLESWDMMLLPGSCHDVTTIDFNTFYAVGAGGLIIYSTNAGSSIEIQPSGTTEFLNAIDFIGRDTGYIAGGHGTILKTTNGGKPIGIKPISNQIPDKLFLYQNYPNPFNPKTNIKFQIVNLSDVKLVLFDILGREITSLVNEQLRPGTYGVKWDGSNYPSGIYLYKLITAEQTQTRKLVLLK
jgi:photosystem II stability/assembly factor-like uncharacterized protein